MIPKNLKIAYINGYGGTGGKAKKLTTILSHKVQPFVIDWDNFTPQIDQKIRKQLKQGGYDVIIAPSTGGYYARDVCHKLDIALIALNPVVDIKKTFAKIDRPEKHPPKIEYYEGPLKELVIVNKDDILINYKDTKAKFKNTKVYNKGGHRFENLAEVKKDVISFLKTI